MFSIEKYLEYLKYINNEESSFKGIQHLDIWGKAVYRISGELPKSIQIEYKLVNHNLMMFNNLEYDLKKKETILLYYPEFTI